MEEPELLAEDPAGVLPAVPCGISSISVLNGKANRGSHAAGYTRCTGKLVEGQACQCPLATAIGMQFV